MVGEGRVSEYLLLEASEPPKTKVADYVRWKDQLGAARSKLGADIEQTAASARVVGVMPNTEARWSAASNRLHPSAHLV